MFRFVSNKKITVLGGGSWGTTIAILLAQRHKIRLWEYSKQQVELMNRYRENKLYLPAKKIPESIFITNNISEALEGCKIVVFAVPSHHLVQTCNSCKPYIKKDMTIVSLIKGIDVESMKRCSEIITEITGNKKTVVLSGPSLAVEVANNIPTAVVVASPYRNLTKLIQRVFITENFRVYTNDDIIGVELAGALKNIIAIAAGISDGLGFGANTKSAIMTRGLREIIRLGTKLGAKITTFFGLAGIGDLVTTCTSKYSRNRYVGEMLGKGKKIDEILSSMRQVAEGVKTTIAAYKLAEKYKIDMPITTTVYNIIYKNKSLKEAARNLMLRKEKDEW